MLVAIGARLGRVTPVADYAELIYSGIDYADVRRLLEIKVTAKQLAQKLEVSERTIYRYMDTLSLSNIPVYTQKGRFLLRYKES